MRRRAAVPALGAGSWGGSISIRGGATLQLQHQTPGRQRLLVSSSGCEWYILLSRLSVTSAVLVLPVAVDRRPASPASWPPPSALLWTTGAATAAWSPCRCGQRTHVCQGVLFASGAGCVSARRSGRVPGTCVCAARSSGLHSHGAGVVCDQAVSTAVQQGVEQQGLLAQPADAAGV